MNQSPRTTIAAARQAAGMTQADLAEASGVKLSTLQKLEIDQKRLLTANTETILRLARALGTTVEALADLSR